MSPHSWAYPCVLAMMLTANGAFADDDSTFAIDALPAAGIYRLRPSVQASNRWALAAFTNARILDSADKPLPCAVVSSNISSRVEMTDNIWASKLERGQGPRPWVAEVVDAPGWLLFQGNGHTPYSIRFSNRQVGTDVCTFVDNGQMKRPPDAEFAQPDWPPEARITHEIENARTIGFMEDPVRRNWAAWAAMVSSLFAVGAGGIWFGEIQRRRKS